MGAVQASAPATPGLRAFFERHHGFVWRSLRLLGVAEADVEDLVQEVFVVASAHLDAIDEPAQAWLLAVARRKAANERRRRRRAERRRDAIAAVPASDSGMGDANLALRRLLEAVPREQAIALFLSEIEGMCAREISQALAVPLFTVYSRIRSAKQKLEAMVRRDREGPP